MPLPPMGLRSPSPRHIKARPTGNPKLRHSHVLVKYSSSFSILKDIAHGSVHARIRAFGYPLTSDFAGETPTDACCSQPLSRNRFDSVAFV